jgi:hypothetical protein
MSAFGSFEPAFRFYRRRLWVLARTTRAMAATLLMDR